MFDCARANKSTSAWGLETRVPFLDLDFVNDAMDVSAEDKMIRKVGRGLGFGGAWVVSVHGRAWAGDTKKQEQEAIHPTIHPLTPLGLA